MKKGRKPNGNNIEIALELLELSLLLKTAVKKTNMNGLKKLAEKHHLLPKLTSPQTKIKKLK